MRHFLRLVSTDPNVRRWEPADKKLPIERDNGKSPVHWASERGQPTVAQPLILSHGADTKPETAKIRPLYIYSRERDRSSLCSCRLRTVPTFNCGTTTTALRSTRHQRVGGMTLCSCCGSTEVRSTLLAANTDLLYRRFEISTSDIRIVTRCSLRLDSIPAHCRVLLWLSCVELQCATA
jgi:hypothetical protein